MTKTIAKAFAKGKAKEGSFRVAGPYDEIPYKADGGTYEWTWAPQNPTEATNKALKCRAAKNPHKQAPGTGWLGKLTRALQDSPKFSLEILDDGPMITQEGKRAGKIADKVKRQKAVQAYKDFCLVYYHDADGNVTDAKGFARGVDAYMGAFRMAEADRLADEKWEAEAELAKSKAEAERRNDRRWKAEAKLAAKR